MVVKFYRKNLPLGGEVFRKREKLTGEEVVLNILFAGKIANARLVVKFPENLPLGGEVFRQLQKLTGKFVDYIFFAGKIANARLPLRTWW